MFLWWMSLTVSRDPRRWGLKHIVHTVCACRCDRRRLVFHGHFVCLCTIMHAYISEAAQGQSQMKLISINPFQIRRADGKRTAFKRPWCSPHLPCRHDYLLSLWCCNRVHYVCSPTEGELQQPAKATVRETSASLNGLEHSENLKGKKQYQRIIIIMWMVPLKELIDTSYINTI